MNKITFKEEISSNVKKIVFESPIVAKKVLPGQFVIVIVDEKGERVPLTVAHSDKEKGVITLIFQEVGKTTVKLGKLGVGDKIFAILGPLGKPTEIKNFGTVVTVGGGVGIAEVYPATASFRQAGNKVISIIGARSKNLLILEKSLKEVCDEFFVTTDDGSSGRKGNVCDALKELLSERKIDLVYAVGPVPMMQAVANVTRSLKIKTLVSLNPIMVDATGMCGVCRVCIAGETKFGCVDGPEFNAHLVDFNDLSKRLSIFTKEEKESMEALG